MGNKNIWKAACQQDFSLMCVPWFSSIFHEEVQLCILEIDHVVKLLLQKLPPNGYVHCSNKEIDEQMRRPNGNRKYLKMKWRQNNVIQINYNDNNATIYPSWFVNYSTEKNYWPFYCFFFSGQVFNFNFEDGPGRYLATKEGRARDDYSYMGTTIQTTANFPETLAQVVINKKCITPLKWEMTVSGIVKHWEWGYSCSYSWFLVNCPVDYAMSRFIAH